MLCEGILRYLTVRDITMCKIKNPYQVNDTLMWMSTFVSACHEPLSLQPHTGPISCHLMDSCTAVDCCIELTQMTKSFHVFLHLDNCYKRLKVGIENYFIDIAYLDYEFGKHLRYNQTSIKQSPVFKGHLFLSSHRKFHINWTS